MSTVNIPYEMLCRRLRDISIDIILYVQFTIVFDKEWLFHESRQSAVGICAFDVLVARSPNKSVLSTEIRATLELVIGENSSTDTAAYIKKSWTMHVLNVLSMVNAAWVLVILALSGYVGERVDWWIGCCSFRIEYIPRFLVHSVPVPCISRGFSRII